MRTSDFDYDLPRALIAQEPPQERGTSRMMVLHRNGERIEHRLISDLPSYLSADDLLVLNDTRVFPARLFGSWADTGGGGNYSSLTRFRCPPAPQMPRTRKTQPAGPASAARGAT